VGLGQIRRESERLLRIRLRLGVAFMRRRYGLSLASEGGKGNRRPANASA
jgi:hypothetical protein